MTVPASSSGTNGSRSSKALLGTPITMTAMLWEAIWFWNDKFRSMVTNAPKPEATARESNWPFLMPFHRWRVTVEIS